MADDHLPGDPGDPGDDPDPPRQEIPFDGGLGTIIALGVAYATKRGIDKRKQKRPIGSGD